jgi:phosphatidylinositol 4-kinase type 2
MTPLEEHKAPFFWTEGLMQDFREQLERLVVLDFIMRNTDRGLDNFMLKYCPAEAPPSSAARSVIAVQPDATEPMSNARRPHVSAVSGTDALSRPHIHMSVVFEFCHSLSNSEASYSAAIDNSLAFPHSHPRGWRNYPFGWLLLPASLIGLPWSQRTRDHFCLLLTDKTWWEELVVDLRATFQQDPDFNAGMFRKQMAVLKGQALNLLQSLRDPEEGPLELCQRLHLQVWDDYVDLPPDEADSPVPNAVDSIPEYAAAEDESETRPLIDPTASPAPSSKRTARRPTANRHRGVSLAEVPQISRKLSSAKNLDDTGSTGISLLEDAPHVPTPARKMTRPRSSSQVDERPFRASHARMPRQEAGGRHARV